MAVRPTAARDSHEDEATGWKPWHGFLFGLEVGDLPSIRFATHEKRESAEPLWLFDFEELAAGLHESECMQILASGSRFGPYGQVAEVDAALIEPISDASSRIKQELKVLRVMYCWPRGELFRAVLLFLLVTATLLMDELLRDG